MNLVLKIEIKKIYFCNCSLTYFCLALVLLLQISLPQLSVSEGMYQYFLPREKVARKTPFFLFPPHVSQYLHEFVQVIRPLLTPQDSVEALWIGPNHMAMSGCHFGAQVKRLVGLIISGTNVSSLVFRRYCLSQIKKRIVDNILEPTFLGDHVRLVATSLGISESHYEKLDLTNHNLSVLDQVNTSLELMDSVLPSRQVPLSVPSPVPVDKITDRRFVENKWEFCNRSTRARQK